MQSNIPSIDIITEADDARAPEELVGSLKNRQTLLAYQPRHFGQRGLRQMLFDLMYVQDSGIVVGKDNLVDLHTHFRRQVE